MITPLMLILSSINEKFTYDKVMDISYLTVDNRNTIIEEANRIGLLIQDNDESTVLYTDSPSGRRVADHTAQLVNDSLVEINPVTAMLLTRIKDAYEVFKKDGGTLAESLDNDDISLDAEIQHIEGNPREVYNYVYKVMTTKGMSYTAGIRKITELYLSITGLSKTPTSGNAAQDKTQVRLALHSSAAFWLNMLMKDWMSCGYTLDKPFTLRDLKIAKNELKSLGIYGFTNPLELYNRFGGSVVTRHTNITVDPEVTQYLDKIIRSGGDS